MGHKHEVMRRGKEDWRSRREVARFTSPLRLLLLCRHQRGLSKELAMWLGSNLVPDERGNLVWSFNIAGASAMYMSYK